MRKKIKCINPENNPKCKMYHHTRSKLCKSCSFYTGRKYVCEYCGNLMEHKSYSSNRFCNKICYRKSEIHSGKGNYFYGGLSEKDKISRLKSINSTSPDELSRRASKMSKISCEVWKRPQYRDNQIKIKADIISSGKFNPNSNHKKGFYNNEYYDSLWELAYMIKLNDMGLTWTKKHGIKIPYTDLNGNNHLYVPDFLVDNKFIKEVKPKNLLKYNNNYYKIKAAIVYATNNSLEYDLVHYEHISDYIERAIIHHEQ